MVDCPAVVARQCLTRLISWTTVLSTNTIRHMMEIQAHSRNRVEFEALPLFYLHFFWHHSIIAPVDPHRTGHV